MKLKMLFQQEDRPAIEKWCRAHVQQAYVGENTALCRVLGTFLMYVDTKDLSLTPHLLMNGYWEMWVTQAIVDYVQPGMRCIDVGANCGYYTLLLAELAGESGHVDAYEPQVRLIDLMSRSLRVSGLLGRVSLLDVCASDEERDGAPMNCDPELLGSAALITGGSYHGFRTRCVPLSEYYMQPIDFVKIDVQGHEMEVLAGMRGIIDRSPGIAIAMEFTPGEHASPIDSLKTIQSYGLKIESIGTDGTVRPVTLDVAATPDTGDHRMLWLTRAKNLTPAPDPT